MFSLFNGIYDSYLAPTQLNLLVVGAPESGKTTLLERLKVTEIPTRPGKGSSSTKTVQQRIAADDPPATLKTALLETGATMGRSRHRSLSRTSLASGTSNSTASKSGPHASPPIPPKAKPSDKTTVTSKGNAVVVTQKKRFSLICPAPERYSRAAQEQDEEYEDEESEELVVGDGQNGGIFREASGNPPLLVRSHSKEINVESLDLSTTDGTDNSMAATDNNDNNNDPRNGNNNRETSMQSIGLDDDDDAHPISPAKALSSTLPQEPLHRLEEHDTGPAILQSSPQEYNVKSNAKMLPLRMIRPTIGTNLAKIDMYGAKCHIFDVGGRLQDLWERYYDDCDAVIFCWKLGEDPDKIPEEPDSDDDSEEEEETVHEKVYKKQQELLDTVRKSIPDDVPFLVLGHVFGNANSQMVDKMYNTDLLLPRYHNPMTGFCCSSAKTGAGVQSAMEWLIPLAKRQQRERIASKRELDMMLEEQGKAL